MILDCLLDPLRLNANIPLGDGGAAVLQKPLDKGYVVTAAFVDLRGVPLAEAMGADAIIA